MIRTRSSERVNEFKALRNATFEVLQKVDDSVDMPGIDMEMLSTLVEASEPALFHRNGELNAQGANDDEITPKILIDKPKDPTVHPILMPSFFNKLSGKVIDRSSSLAHPTIQGFLTSLVVEPYLLPVVVTLKPDNPTEQTAHFAHEVTHWMDDLNGINDEVLTEKRAHYITHAINRINGSKYYLDTERATLE